MCGCSVLGILVYVVGIPVFFGYVLWKKRKADQLNSAESCELFGFLYLGNKPGMYAWQLVSFARLLKFAFRFCFFCNPLKFGSLISVGRAGHATSSLLPMRLHDFPVSLAAFPAGMRVRIRAFMCLLASPPDPACFCCASLSLPHLNTTSQARADIDINLPPISRHAVRDARNEHA
jgi:hypothetical protein